MRILARLLGVTALLFVVSTAVAQAPDMPPDRLCPLDKKDARAAAAAFEAMLPVLQHPRCMNCHGTFGDLQENRATKHPGGFVPEGSRITETNLDDCTGCHNLGAIRTRDGIAWRLPPPHLFFTQDPITICKRFRTMGEGRVPRGIDLLNHMSLDAAIKLGFQGTKGQSNSVAEPPPMAHDDFLKLAEHWIASLYRSRDEAAWAGAIPGEAGSACGCDPDVFTAIASGIYKAVVTHGEMRFESLWTLNVDSDGVTGISEWDCCPDPRSDPLISGRIIDGKRLVIQRNCTGGGAGSCLQTFDGEVDEQGVIVGTWTGSYRHPDKPATWTLTPLESPD